MLKTDPAYKFGCGRYLQGKNILEQCGQEILRLHCCKPVIVGGHTALSLTVPRITASLNAQCLSFMLWEYNGYCCASYIEKLIAYIRENECDLILGVGGGTIMDFAKAAAASAKLPVINIPTSAATCAAYTPLSVMYSEEGKTLPPSQKHKSEVNAVLTDLDIMLTQPPRLLIAGAYDSMAKHIELLHRTKDKKAEDIALGLDYSCLLAEHTFRQCQELLPDALRALDEKQCNPAFERILYINIAVTGIISGIAKGSSQTALAHEFYELVRTLFTREARDFIHGELVAMGLIVQLAYNKEEKKIPALCNLLKQYGLPVYLQDLHIPATEENLKKLFLAMSASDSMAEEDLQNHKKLQEALTYLCAPER